MKVMKKEKYELLCHQIKSLISGERNRIGVLSNVSAAVHDAFPEELLWIGFYLVKDSELQLGPFQGPVACMHIQKGRGVCGTAWKLRQSIVVSDVEKFPGHIACSSESRSEIVVPLFGKSSDVVGVIDADSRDLNAFDDIDRQYLENIAKILSNELAF